MVNRCLQIFIGNYYVNNKKDGDKEMPNIEKAVIHGDRVITDIVDDVLIATWLDTSYTKNMVLEPFTSPQ